MPEPSTPLAMVRETSKESSGATVVGTLGVRTKGPRMRVVFSVAAVASGEMATAMTVREPLK